MFGIQLPPGCFYCFVLIRRFWLLQLVDQVVDGLDLFGGEVADLVAAVDAELFGYS